MDTGSPQKIELVFYQTENGNEPVRDWLVELPSEMTPSCAPRYRPSDVLQKPPRSMQL